MHEVNSKSETIHSVGQKIIQLHEGHLNSQTLHET